TQDPSRARDIPGQFQYAALGVRDFTIGLSRSTAVSAAPSRGSRFCARRGRPTAAACRRPLLSGGSDPSTRCAGGPDARAEPHVGEEPGGVRPPQGGRTHEGGRGEGGGGGRGRWERGGRGGGNAFMERTSASGPR